ncbi:MAG: hypothetical protein K0R54_2760 [Clostridiaceae bacterium]|jgi:hypothetical protein|nr:hypothetical protein [Clostridiaceae bacterium]MDF2950478.1 hypothetical protein [Anaerocolumna sp.]
MGINVEEYKVIYKDVVYNPLTITPIFKGNEDFSKSDKIQFIEMFYINEDGELRFISDEAWCFKFVRR